MRSLWKAVVHRHAYNYFYSILDAHKIKKKKETLSTIIYKRYDPTFELAHIMSLLCVRIGLNFILTGEIYTNELILFRKLLNVSCMINSIVLPFG